MAFGPGQGPGSIGGTPDTPGGPGGGSRGGGGGDRSSVPGPHSGGGRRGPPSGVRGGVGGGRAGGSSTGRERAIAGGGHARRDLSFDDHARNIATGILAGVNPMARFAMGGNIAAASFFKGLADKFGVALGPPGGVYDHDTGTFGPARGESGEGGRPDPYAEAVGTEAPEDEEDEEETLLDLLTDLLGGNSRHDALVEEVSGSLGLGDNPAFAAAPDPEAEEPAQGNFPLLDIIQLAATMTPTVRSQSATLHQQRRGRA